VDFLARRVMYKAVDNLDLTEGEQPLDFDAGALRPVSVLPPPFPPDLSARENGQVKLVATDQALHLWVTSKSYPGQAVRLDWEDRAAAGRRSLEEVVHRRPHPARRRLPHPPARPAPARPGRGARRLRPGPPRLHPRLIPTPA
jgi:hypothetical protein